MKKNDIASIILITVISFSLAFLLGNAFFDKPESRSTSVEMVNEIDSALPEPSTDIFNQNSINPTEDITIGEGGTDNPFER